MSNIDLTIYCDGGARGNPGPAASAFVAVDNNETIHEDSKFLGKATNNVAEYQAVIMALEWLKENQGDRKNVLFVLDSELITRQLTGQYKIKSETLIPLVTKAKELEKKIDANIFYRWSPRTKNKAADQLVNEELDENNDS